MSLIVHFLADDFRSEIDPKPKVRLQYLVCVEGDCHDDGAQGAAQICIVPAPAKRPPAAKAKGKKSDEGELALVLTGWKKEATSRRSMTLKMGSTRVHGKPLTARWWLHFSMTATSTRNSFHSMEPRLTGGPTGCEALTHPNAESAVISGKCGCCFKSATTRPPTSGHALHFFQCQKHGDVFEVVEQST